MKHSKIKSVKIRRSKIILLCIVFMSHFSFSQAIIDSCLSSVTPNQTFNSSTTMANVDNSDALEWNGTSWTGAFANANLTIPPPVNLASCRAVFIGSSTTWTTGGESFGLLLSAGLVSGQTYSFDFTYVSHGLGSNGSFSPYIHTNSTSSLTGSVQVGTLPAVGNAWTTNTFTFTATAAQAGHTWLIIGTQPNGSSGLVNSFCSSCGGSTTLPCNVSINLGPDTTLCQGETLALDATSPNSTYLWQDNSTNATFNVTQAGTYWVQVTDTCGTLTDTITVNYTPLPIVDLGPDTTLCQGETLTLDATHANATYLWQDTSANATFNVSTQGVYFVEVTVNNCQAYDTINVSYTPLPIVNLGNDIVACEGDMFVLNATNINATYLWQDNSTNPTYTVSQSGTYWVEVIANNCRNSDTLNATYNPLPTTNLGNDTTLCQGEVLTLDATELNATYLWQDNTTAPTYTVNQQGVYWAEVTINNCTLTDSITVNYNPLPIIDLGNDTTLCQIGSTITLDAGFPNATYLWQDNSTNSTLTVSQQGTYWVELTVNGCSYTDTIFVATNFNPLPTINLGNDTTLCSGASLTLNASTPNSTYLWNDNSTGATLAVTNAGSYFVELNIDGCFTSDTIQVSVQTVNPDFDYNGSIGCFPTDVDFFDQSAVNLGNLQSWEWQDHANGLSSAGQTSTSTFFASGSYDISLKVTSDLGCTQTITKSIPVEVTPEVIAGFNFNPEIGLSQESDIQFTNTSQNATVWEWSFGDNSTASSENPSHVYQNSGNYLVVLVAANDIGCYDTTTSYITIKEPITVYAPNTFSPDDNSANQEWRFSIIGIDIYDFTVIIYNRWGEIVWKSHDPDAGWDGTYHEELVHDGVYIWHMEVRDPINSKRHEFVGNITILR